MQGIVHQTPFGPVEVVAQVPEDHRELAPLFIDAACDYLDLYTPLLGPYPYRRFSIVENFFSSGFAYPGFTLLGPQVVAMGPRSLLPGYLDHELLHNWWGNGVYIDPGDGNWCEALTTFCANYYRRIAEGGQAAGLAHRRGILMKLSTDPQTLDDGPLGEFGSADPTGGGPDRFVGYDKGAFVFSMLADVIGSRLAADGDDPLWASLRRFADRNLGRRATWRDLQSAFEASEPQRPAGWLDAFFDAWVRRHTVPVTIPGEPAEAPREFAGQFAGAGQQVEIRYGPDGDRCEIDPEFRLYRVLPPRQLIPTIAATFGRGGVAVDAERSRPEVAAYLPQLEIDDDGENLLLIGYDAIRRHADLIGKCADSCTVDESSFSVGGTTYDRPGQALLHTMSHPDRPGRFVTVFHGNGEAGWQRLRLIRFYSRDTTIVWEDGRVIERRVFEPDRTIALDGTPDGRAAPRRER
jgi:hypothetical protein